MTNTLNAKGVRNLLKLKNAAVNHLFIVLVVLNISLTNSKVAHIANHYINRNYLNIRFIARFVRRIFVIFVRVINFMMKILSFQLILKFVKSYTT